jgi:hypothetical protein
MDRRRRAAISTRHSANDEQLNAKNRIAEYVIRNAIEFGRSAGNPTG